MARTFLVVPCLLLAACGGAPPRAAHAEPDATGAYDLSAERRVPAGVSWDEHAVYEMEEQQVTEMGSETERTARRARVELVGRVTVLEDDRSTITITVLTADEGAGPRAILAPGEVLTVVHGPSGSMAGPRGPLSEGDAELVGHVVHVSRSAAGHDEASRAFGPPGGRARVGESWPLDHEAIAALLAGQSNDVRVRPDAVDGTGRLLEGTPFEGHPALRIELDMTIRALELPLPAGAIIDAAEVRLVGATSWPLDLGVPPEGDTIRSETSVNLHVESPELGGIVPRVHILRVEATTATRSALRAP